MKTRNQMKPLARLIAASLAVGSMAGFGAQALAQTAAGTLIKNLATVTYEDENGNSYSAQSNEAVVTVAPVFSATIETDGSLTGAPGQTVYFPHTLSNTGNTPDTFTVTADSGAVVYLDANNNGQPDPGEVPVTGPVSVAAGEQANLVVALSVPGTAANGTTLTTKLTAVSAGGAVVEDTGANADTTDGTNDDTVTVSTGPILVLNKSAVTDEANNSITYTLTVKNTGGSDAANVNIVDAIPEVDHDGDSTTAAVQMTFDSVSANGLLNAGDVVPTGTTSLNEADKGDLNLDGDTTDTLQGIVAKDVTLPPGTTVSVVYTVKYDPTWEAGASVENTFIAFDDPDGNGNPDDATVGPVSSNTTSTTIAQTYGAQADDTNLGASPGVNDGGDDGAAAVADDIQLVDLAATGEEVKFQHIITNSGNGDDTYNIAVTNDATDGFPAGTAFSYWDSTGTVQLTDSNNDGIPDTGVLGAGANQTIMVKANLPAGISGEPTNGYNATLTATSTEDPAATPSTDTTALKLAGITAPFVDIANVTADQGLAGFNVADGLANAQDEAPAVLAAGTVGGSVTFDLQLANESGSPDTFFLGSGNVPAGWSVVYKDTAGNVITTTPLVAGGGVFSYKAEVTISANPSEAMGDSDQVGAVDGYDDADDGTTPAVFADFDGDLDYKIDFMATSTSTPTVSDSVTNAVDIETTREVVITPNGQNQVQPGGTVDYSHNLENNGNQTETVELGSSNNQPGWTNVISVDTTGDGIPDTILTSLSVGDIVKGVDDDGNPVDIEVVDTDGDGILELQLEPGENATIKSTVTAPSNAPQGTTNSSIITAVDPDTDATLSSSTDQSTVMLGQVRLEKTSAIDRDCNGEVGAGDVGFAASHPGVGVEPDECIIWNLTATNEGAETVKNVVISDAAPAFTEMMPAFTKFCHGNACAPTTAGGTANSVYAAGLIKFFAENGASNPAGGIGGELLSGEQMTGQFTVKVQ